MTPKEGIYRQSNTSGTDQAINKWKTALSTTIVPMFNENNFVNFDPITKNDLDL